VDSEDVEGRIVQPFRRKQLEEEHDTGGDNPEKTGAPYWNLKAG
jgi:hypothetical protein